MSPQTFSYITGMMTLTWRQSWLPVWRALPLNNPETYTPSSSRKSLQSKQCIGFICLSLALLITTLFSELDGSRSRANKPGLSDSVKLPTVVTLASWRECCHVALYYQHRSTFCRQSKASMSRNRLPTIRLNSHILQIWILNTHNA